MASVLGLLFAVLIFSKSCITSPALRELRLSRPAFAGEKKCVPMTLVGSFKTAAMSSMFRPLVLVQMRQSGFVFFSMSKKTYKNEPETGRKHHQTRLKQLKRGQKRARARSTGLSRHTNGLLFELHDLRDGLDHHVHILQVRIVPQRFA